MIGQPAFVACGWTTTSAERCSSCCDCSSRKAGAETSGTGEITTGREGAAAHGSGGSALKVGVVVHAGTLGGGVGSVGWVWRRGWGLGRWTYRKMSNLPARVAATVPDACTADTKGGTVSLDVTEPLTMVALLCCEVKGISFVVMGYVRPFGGRCVLSVVRACGHPLDSCPFWSISMIYLSG